MIASKDWPALLRGSSPHVLECERGVWGKAHGAPTDFRWLAQSAGFDRDRPSLPRELSLGGEDVLAQFQAWRNLGDRCYAMTCYPSRAIDASGRRGFLEKQVLEWHRPSHVPAALGALLLLPRAAALTDAVWWDRDDVMELRYEPHAVLLIAKPEATVVDEEELAETIERGREALRKTLGSKSLQQLYDQLLAGRAPSYLSGLHEPLSPEALAALLLPLPRELADRISIAGWVPTDRPSFEDLGNRWEVLTADRSVAPIAPEKAHPLVQMLLNADVRGDAKEARQPLAPRASEGNVQPFRPGTTLELRAPDADAPPFLRELYAFANARDRRWLDPASLRCAGRGSWGELLCEWVATVRDSKPPYADREQWTAKVDLLRSAAIVLAPFPSTLRAIGMPDEKSRVPALLFGLALMKSDWKVLLGLGESSLGPLVEQSRRLSRSNELTQRLKDLNLR